MLDYIFLGDMLTTSEAKEKLKITVKNDDDIYKLKTQLFRDFKVIMCIDGISLIQIDYCFYICRVAK